jgi:hypothetical protein
MLAPNPLVVTPVWPIPGDVQDLQAIVWSQMKTIANNAVLLAAYQSNLNNAQTTPPAQAFGTSAGTASITLTGLVGTILLGSVITGGSIPSGTYLVNQTSGPTGGNGVYTTSQSTTTSNTQVFIYPNGANPPWPTATDADTLMLLTQDQMAVARLQNALLTAYQTLLNDSSTAPPATGP